MQKKPSCEKCKRFWKARNKQPNCEDCLPEILPENEDAIAVYTQVYNQAIYVGMDAVPIDLDFKAIQIVMDLLEIEDKKDCFQKVYKTWHHVNEMNRVKRKSKNA